MRTDRHRFPGAKFFVSLVLAAALLWGVPQAEAYRFVVYGDSPATNPQWPQKTFNNEVLGYINAQITQLQPKPDFVLFLGDLVTRGAYPQGKSTLNGWKTFMQNTLRVDGVPIKIYVVPGNRDLYGPQGWPAEPALQKVYQEVFSDMPSNGPPGYDKLAYWFEYGEGLEKSFFIALNAFGFKSNGTTVVNWDNGLDQAQLDWLRNQAQAHQSTAHHKFAFSHGPAFSTGGYHVDPSVSQSMWLILETTGFDFFFAGHEHLYSRGNNPNPSHYRVFQVINGSAGASLMTPGDIKVDPNLWHIHFNDNLSVVDVNGSNIHQEAFAVIPGEGGYSLQSIDNVFISK
ncbi:MAG: metallophosphoesterase [Syntrophales bacterium]|nr:metallophosphoesterase [Syntrophales bacterium]MDD5643191.1 metallophosphoesterase [Syntrophales bacterium]